MKKTNSTTKTRPAVRLHRIVRHAWVVVNKQGNIIGTGLGGLAVFPVKYRADGFCIRSGGECVQKIMMANAAGEVRRNAVTSTGFLGIPNQGAE